MMISLIVAYSKNRVIGDKGKIPWEIKGEKSRFKELTLGNVVIMGRKTYEEIGSPLPNRLNIIISKTHLYNEENCITATSLKAALKIAEGRNIFIAGGQKLYEESLEIVDKMYITLIEKDFDGDRFFPKFNENDWILEENGYFQGEISYRYLTYTRKNKVK